MLFLLIISKEHLMAQPDFEGEVESLDSLNSPYDERYLLAASENAFYFSRVKNPVNPGGAENPGDIWLVQNQEPIKRVNFSTSQSLNVPIALAGSQFLFAEVEERFASFTTRFFFMAGQEKKEMTIPYFSNRGAEVSGHLSSDGRFLVLSLEGNVTYGVEDIYVCIREANGSWGAPKNLGNTINTPFQEFTPFLMPDGKTIYWSSNGLGGEGSFDVFESTRLDDTWQNWSKPKNIGSQVNTQGAEISFQLSGEYAYFVSTQDSDGYGDLKRIALRDPLPEQKDSISLENKVEKVAWTFEIKDESDGTSVVADLFFTGLQVDTSFLAVSSLFFELKEVQDLNFSASAKGYLPVDLLITASDLEATESFEISMKPLSIGTTVQLQNVLFQRGTTEFIKGSSTELDKVVDLLQQNPAMKILVKGHTDNIGDPTRNLRLSQQRAKKVADYLVSKGIAFNRVQNKGYGGNSPIASNDREETRKLNRRVEFTIIE